jgi:hypothetical protein
MARKYRRRFSYARRAYRFGGRSYGGKMGLNISPAFLAGMAIGFTDLDQKIPGQLVLGTAVAPIKGIGTIKAGAQGIIFGNLLQTIKNGGLSASGFKGI